MDLTMKKVLCLVLALLTVCGSIMLASCSKDAETNSPADDTKAEAPAKKLSDFDMQDIFNAVNEKLPFDGLVSEVCYKETDADEMIFWTYGLIEASCYEKLENYVITLPSDYNQSFAVIVFDESITDDEIQEVKDVVSKQYIKARASSLQMYMPEEYDIVSWQLNNPDAIWRQYDNTLVLLMYGAEEATEGWAAIDALLK